jgi:hypothetical protein
MAKRVAKEAARQLTLKIEGPRITADRFLKAVSSFVALINEVSETVTSERNAFRWLVSVEAGSAIVHFKPEPNRANPDLAASSIKAINNGISAIRKRPERPPYFSDNALRKVKELADVLDADSHTIDHMSVAADNAAIELTRAISVNVDELIGAEYRALGSIEGRLRTVTEAGGVHFVVQDGVTHNNVRCFFDLDRADEYMGAWRKRVSVYGEIRYRRDGVPVSINVHRFRVFKDDSELPSVKDVRGILAA